MGTNEFGYVGASRTQSSSSNNGVFGSDDVYDLLSENKWALQTADFEYLVIAGAGGGASGGCLNQGNGERSFSWLEAIETLMLLRPLAAN